MELRTLKDLEWELAALPAADCPTAIGELERLRALLWTRMLNGHKTHDQEKAWLTMPQVAARLNITPYRAYELARQGKLPSVHIGKYVRVSSEQFLEYQKSLENQECVR